MVKQAKWVYLLCLLASSSLSADEIDIPFIVEDACPFEGCSFGAWEVLSETIVFQQPNEESPIVGRLAKGTKAPIVTGIQFIIPGEAIITGKPYSDAELFNPSKKVYILNYWGEGFSQIFHNGNFIDTKIARRKTQCAEEPNWRYCWVEVLQEPQSKWWVKVKDVGWVLMKRNSLKPIDAFAMNSPYNKALQPDSPLLTPFAAACR